LLLMFFSKSSVVRRKGVIRRGGDFSLFVCTLYFCFNVPPFSLPKLDLKSAFLLNRDLPPANNCPFFFFEAFSFYPSRSLVSVSPLYNPWAFFLWGRMVKIFPPNQFFFFVDKFLPLLCQFNLALPQKTLFPLFPFLHTPPPFPCTFLFPF